MGLRGLQSSNIFPERRVALRTAAATSASSSISVKHSPNFQRAVLGDEMLRAWP